MRKFTNLTIIFMRLRHVCTPLNQVEQPVSPEVFKLGKSGLVKFDVLD